MTFHVAPGRRRFLGLAAATLALAAGRSAQAQQEWPARPVHLVLPFPPGGGADTVARAVSARLAEIRGQPVVLENRTGGLAIVAASGVLTAPRDGYTLLWDGANQITNPFLVKEQPFDYKTSFIPITLLARFPQVLAVKQDFPAATLDEFIAYAKARPAKVSCGTPPSAGMGHLALERLQQRAGIKLIHTPYRGAPDAAREIQGGHIDSVIMTTSTIRPPLEAGKVRILAVTSAERIAVMPDIPTIAERGFPGFDMDDFNGLYAPAGTPPVAIQKMQAAAAQALRDPAVLARMAPLGTILVGNSTEEFTKWLAAQRDVVEGIIRDAKITLS
jgi:tripartite-type tricarboxylate transporter receptor subunit TctC